VEGFGFLGVRVVRHSRPRCWFDLDHAAYISEGCRFVKEVRNPIGGCFLGHKITDHVNQRNPHPLRELYPIMYVVILVTELWDVLCNVQIRV
jgi:hypothetical protein